MTSIPEIRTLAELDAALDPAEALPLVLLKHSTRCGTSSAAFEEFSAFVAGLSPGAARTALVLVVEHRDVSDAVGLRLGVHHASPQAFVVAAGRAVWSATHWDVTAAGLAQALAAAAAA